MVQSPAFASKVSEIGVIPATSTPDKLAARIRDTSSAFAAIVERHQQCLTDNDSLRWHALVCCIDDGVLIA